MDFELFDRESPIEASQSISSRMQLFDEAHMSKILRSQFISDKYDYMSIQKASHLLLKKSNLNIYLQSESFRKDISKMKTVEHFETRYTVSKFPQGIIDFLKNPRCDGTVFKMGLPAVNELYPTTFGVYVKEEKYSRHPILVK